MASSSSSLRKCIFGGQALVLLVLLLGGEMVRVQADCDTNSIESSLTSCFSQLNSAPNANSACCDDLRSLKKNVNPSDACICSILTSSTVEQAGLTKDKAAAFIDVCIGSYALPTCLQ